MRLTAEEHPEAIKRYAHVRRARGWRARPCGSRFGETTFSCTRERAHGGPHVAHVPLRGVAAVWDGDAGERAPKPTRRAPGPTSTRKRGTRSPIGLPERSGGLLEALRARLSRALDSAEEIAFLIFFLAFVGFAVHWFVLLLG